MGDAPSTAIRFMRCGVSMAIFSATWPPIELPTKWADGIATASMNASSTRAVNVRRPMGIATLSDRPYWGRSTRNVRCLAANAGALDLKLLHALAPGPAPWRQITGSPRPSSW